MTQRSSYHVLPSWWKNDKTAKDRALADDQRGKGRFVIEASVVVIQI